jgi:hypothetical protein
MKLIREFVDRQNIEILKEIVEDNGQKKEVLRLKGPFLEAEIRNKNNRIYPLKVLQREVKKYNEERIAKNRAVGTCDHEETPQISLDRISHVIESLEMKDNIGYGVARVIDTPTGKILKTLVSEGIILGVSTRGVGSLDEDGTVKEDFALLSIDAVIDNSAPHCFVEGVLENKNWAFDGDKIVEVAIDNLKKKVDKKFDPKSFSSLTLSYVMDFIKDLNK